MGCCAALRTAVAIPFLGLALCAFVVPVGAAPLPYLQPTASDTLSHDPLRVRVTFDLVNRGDAELCEFSLVPAAEVGAPDTCHDEAAVAPAGWQGCSRAEGASWWAPAGAGDGYAECLKPGERRSGFALVLDAGVCCHIAFFLDPIGMLYGSEEACLAAPAVAVHATTWGRLKAHYR